MRIASRWRAGFSTGALLEGGFLAGRDRRPQLGDQDPRWAWHAAAALGADVVYRRSICVPARNSGPARR